MWWWHDMTISCKSLLYKENYIWPTGWWLTYPSEKYYSVGVTISNIWKNKIHVPNHQPDDMTKHRSSSSHHSWARTWIHDLLVLRVPESQLILQVVDVPVSFMGTSNMRCWCTGNQLGGWLGNPLNWRFTSRNGDKWGEFSIATFDYCRGNDMNEELSITMVDSNLVRRSFSSNAEETPFAMFYSVAKYN